MPRKHRKARACSAAPVEAAPAARAAGAEALVRLIFLSGLSGSGKSVALHMLEDLDFYCIDNIPAPLLQTLHLAYGAQRRRGLSSAPPSASMPAIPTPTSPPCRR